MSSTRAPKEFVPGEVTARGTTRLIARVDMSINTLIEMNFEEFLDHLAEEAGDPLLQDISYKVVGVYADGRIKILVEGDPWEGDV